MAISSAVRILHVDDDPGFADLTAEMLERENEAFSVDTATTPDAALERLQQTDFDCIVSDYEMPQTDGIELLRTVRETHPTTPFILFTGKGSEEVASEALSAGATDYLQKQPGAEQYELLANQIANAVSARAAERRAERQTDLIRQSEFLGDTGGWELDLDTGAVRCTPGTRRLCGRSEIPDRAAFVGCFAASDRPAVRAALQEAADAAEQVRGEYRLDPSGGSERTVQLTIDPVSEDRSVVALRGALRDITDRLEREKALKRAETVFTHAQDMLFVISHRDGEFRYRRVNEAYEEATGLLNEYVRGKTLQEVFGEQRAAEIAQRYRECIERGDAIRYEESYERADVPTEAPGPDETTYWETQIAPVEIDGTVEYIIGATRDINDRKQREWELQRYQTVFDEAPDPIVVCDETGCYDLLNDAAVDLLDNTRDALSGTESQYLAQIQSDHPEEYEALRSGDRESLRVELTAEFPGAGERTLDCRLARVRCSEGPGEIAVLTRDITERTRRERELQTLTRQYQTLVEHFPDGGVFLFDCDCRYVRAGGQELAEVGLASDEFIGQTPHDLFPEPIAAETVENYRAVLDGESNTFEQEYQGEHYRIQTVPVRDDDGEITHGMAVSENVTAQLQRRQRLERQNERLAEFASIVSHDLRNPLQVASSHLALVEPDAESEHVTAAAEALDRCGELIDDLLALARDGVQIDALDTADLGTVATEAWETVRTDSAELVVAATEPIQADPGRLRQLFENLFRNAAEHAGPDVTVTVGLLDDGFYVEDDGEGIPADRTDEVLQAGYSTGDGTGFGLRIVDQIVRAHGWGIEITESEAGGARFEITAVATAE
ncbi:PAS domain-containing protein [Halovenus sp. WSH3]|uniref:histidine kinase n=1 Tax=Halovenus carboxidivorans TaxID=2692199 RepID=A0A6B0T4U9_9EURY|nr:PAS domain-containing protein [Halovenus carboxidivorans]MXR50251.1 PAS domain-containing protein [Halovenus carboxidivorans]